MDELVEARGLVGVAAGRRGREVRAGRCAAPGHPQLDALQRRAAGIRDRAVEDAPARGLVRRQQPLLHEAIAVLPGHARGQAQVLGLPAVQRDARHRDARNIEPVGAQRQRGKAERAVRGGDGLADLHAVAGQLHADVCLRRARGALHAARQHAVLPAGEPEGDGRRRIFDRADPAAHDAPGRNHDVVDPRGQALDPECAVRVGDRALDLAVGLEQPHREIRQARVGVRAQDAAHDRGPVDRAGRSVGQRLQPRDDGQLAGQAEVAVPPVRVPGIALPGRGQIARAVVRDEPMAHREVAVRAAHPVDLARALHELRDLGHPFGVHVRADARVAAILLPADDRPALRADDRNGVAQGLLDHLIHQVEGQEAGRVIRQRVAGVLVRPPPLVDLVARPALPGPLAQPVVLLLADGLAFLVDRVIGVVERVVDRVVVDGHPGALGEQVGAAPADDLRDRVEPAAHAHRGQRGQAAQRDHPIGVDDEVVDDHVEPVGRHLAALPFDGQIRLVVGLEIAHARRHHPADGVLLAAADVARVGLDTVEADDGHDVRGEQALAQLEC
ncbi:MAG: hypothetical protein BWY52_03232 [Chloroflexi bacterium ADurb.Bin325]|nr:MAG: hypothetical protein BWY52_03232 [Chloroflexi bacterium ADurb.Bin325]